MAAPLNQVRHILSSYYAPRGRKRLFSTGIMISQMYLTPYDKLIGIMGDPGCGKSALVKGMFPGLELTNDDDGVNIRPLPILSVDEDAGFFSPHTYHLDIRFETGFSQLPVLADAIMTAIHKGKRVVVEHFELVYPLLPINANLLIGVGEEILVSRPDIFGPEPQEIYDVVHKSLPYRLMAHTAEDICESILEHSGVKAIAHGDVRHGFTLIYDHKPDIDIQKLEEQAREIITSDLPVTYYDDEHIKLGDHILPCTGPRTHVRSTGMIENFTLLWDFIEDHISNRWILVGAVGDKALDSLKKLESMQKWDAMATTQSDFIF